MKNAEQKKMGLAASMLSDSGAFKRLLTETGYSTDLTLQVAENIAEICVIDCMIEQITKNHQRGELLPARFEVELEIEPISLHRTTTVDVLEKLEDINVLVPRRGNTYRGMLSAMMNRLFELTSNNTEGSIRAKLSKIRNAEPILETLENIEWELVKKIHDEVDTKYIDVESLKQQIVPEDLLENFQDSSDLARKIEATGGVAKYIVSLPTGKPTEEIKLVSDYCQSIITLDKSMEKHVGEIWGIIQGLTMYPRSFLGRKSAPLVNSSWLLSPDFKRHPLMMKFQEVIRKNHDMLAEIGDIYEDYITEIVDGSSELPFWKDALDVLSKKYEIFPAVDDVQAALEAIKKNGAGLKVQAKMVEKMVSSMDTLFDTIKS